MTGSATSSSSTAPAGSQATRRFPIGAEYLGNGRTHVRVWAPAAQAVTVVVQAGASTPLQAESGGYFSGGIEAAAGARYSLRLDGSNQLLPDPASRFQPDGPHGVSEVIDPGAFTWTDSAWAGARREGQVVYELHVGTFTREGTWAAAEGELKKHAR